MDSVINGINGLVSGWDQVKNAANNYLSKNADIGNPQYVPELNGNDEMEKLDDGNIKSGDVLGIEAGAMGIAGGVIAKSKSEESRINDKTTSNTQSSTPRKESWAETSVAGSASENPRVKAEREAQLRASKAAEKEVQTRKIKENEINQKVEGRAIASSGTLQDKNQENDYLLENHINNK